MFNWQSSDNSNECHFPIGTKNEYVDKYWVGEAKTKKYYREYSDVQPHKGEKSSQLNIRRNSLAKDSKTIVWFFSKIQLINFEREATLLAEKTRPFLSEHNFINNWHLICAKSKEKKKQNENELCIFI